VKVGNFKKINQLNYLESFKNWTKLFQGLNSFFEINTEFSEFRFQPNIFVLFNSKEKLQSPKEEFVSFQQFENK
jgi:hypothetical protein